MNCPNCGAPMEGDKCGYCGYTLLNIINFEPGKVCYVKMRYLGKELTAKMCVKNINADASCETIEVTALGDRNARFLPSEPTLRVNLEFVSV